MVPFRVRCFPPVCFTPPPSAFLIRVPPRLPRPTILPPCLTIRWDDANCAASNCPPAACWWEARHVHESGVSDHRGNFGGAVTLPPPANFYLTANLKAISVRGLGDLTLGLAVLLLFGIKYKYPDGVPFVTAVTCTSLELTDIKPTIGIGADSYTFLPFWGESQGDGLYSGVFHLGRWLQAERRSYAMRKRGPPSEQVKQALTTLVAQGHESVEHPLDQFIRVGLDTGCRRPLSRK